MSAARKADFVHRFEGGEILQELLSIAGSPISSEETLQRMREGASEGKAAQDIIPTLFTGEPRFPDPSLAMRLYQNLLGLWDLVKAGKPVRLDHPSPPPRKPKAVPPPPFGPEGPTGAFVEAAWRYIEDLDKRGRDRLQHSFENRQDALLSFLEEHQLSDNAVDCARLLLFELFAMIELGWPAGIRSVARKDLHVNQPSAVAPALEAYIDEALLEAELDEEVALSKTESTVVRSVVRQGLRALWLARR